MYKSSTNLRVRYAETDQMSVVYYGIYPQYFEVGRVEAMRELGLSYRQMEEAGIMMPVLHLEVKYHRPALYDDELRIDTFVKEMPQSRIRFDHEIYDSSGALLTTGSVQLVFIEKKSRKPVRCPEILREKLQAYFQ